MVYFKLHKNIYVSFTKDIIEKDLELNIFLFSFIFVAEYVIIINVNQVWWHCHFDHIFISTTNDSLIKCFYTFEKYGHKTFYLFSWLIFYLKNKTPCWHYWKLFNRYQFHAFIHTKFSTMCYSQPKPNFPLYHKIYQKMV